MGLIDRELRAEIHTATKQELQIVINTLLDFAEQNNMENLYEDEITPIELTNTGISKKEARILWGLKHILKHAK